MSINTDKCDQLISEVELEGCHFRVTYVERGWTGSPALRLQIRGESGHVMPGPEIPVSAVGEVFLAISEVLVAGMGPPIMRQ